MYGRWMRGPIGLDSENWVTRAGCRSVLVPVPNFAAGTRLLDIVPLLERDTRLQVVFTVPDAADFWPGTEEFTRAHGGLVVPWHQAIRHRFDLVLAASYTELARVRGRVLVLPHGAGSLMSRQVEWAAKPQAATYVGLGRETLFVRGRLIPSVIALTHQAELAALRQSCPEALPNAVVAGDICLDRLLASQPLREQYRRTLGLREGQRLITVSSTWSSASAFGQHPELCHRLLAELPSADYRVAVVLHPNIWAVHGRRQVLAWLADCIGAGLLVIPPEEGWRATMVATDLVIGDYGSTTLYAAAIGRPVLLAKVPEGVVRPGSAADVLAGVAPRLDPSRPLPPQLQRAIEGRVVPDGDVAHLVTSHPGQAAATLRRLMYRLLELPEPGGPAQAQPVPAPRPVVDVQEA
jgi:hypothetical protein